MTEYVRIRLDEDKVDANTFWALSSKYHARAQSLRVTGQEGTGETQ